MKKHFMPLGTTFKLLEYCLHKLFCCFGYEAIFIEQSFVNKNCSFLLLELATDLQAQMSAESTAMLQTQVQKLKNENSELMKTVLANEGLKKVKVRLDQADTEMVSALQHQ